MKGEDRNQEIMFLSGVTGQMVVSFPKMGRLGESQVWRGQQGVIRVQT